MRLLTNEVLLASDDALTQMLGARIKTLWDARRSVDASRLNPLLTDDYTAVIRMARCMCGSRPSRKLP